MVLTVCAGKGHALPAKRWRSTDFLRVEELRQPKPSRGADRSHQTVASVRDEKLATHGLIETLYADPSLSVFAGLLKAANLNAELSNGDLFTIIAPLNESFSNGKQAVENVPEHILRGAFTADELKSSPTVKTLAGTVLQITNEHGVTSVGGARLVRTDIECTNGVLHVADSVLRPPDW